jgi:hypothetical protein
VTRAGLLLELRRSQPNLLVAGEDFGFEPIVRSGTSEIMIHHAPRLTSNDDELSASGERPVKVDEKRAVGVRERSMTNGPSFKLVDALLKRSSTDAGCNRERKPEAFIGE